MLRKRLASLLLILPLMLGLCVAAYKFGPSPGKSVEQVAAGPVAEPEPRKAEVSSPADSQIFTLFGMYQTAVAKGRVQVSPTEYLNQIEARYRQRGYRKLEDFDPQTAKKRKPENLSMETVALKFFQRDEGNGIAHISATGDDADYSSDQLSLEPYTFTTLVVPFGSGGADWATYRTVVDLEKAATQLAHLEQRDFPGSDPQDIPRLPGLQRIYALASGNGSIAIYKSKEAADTAVIMQYLKEMPRHGWRLDPAATSAANQVTSGVMCFTLGTRSSLIWVTAGKDGSAANVTISSR